MLHVEEVVKEGQTKPFELAKNEIMEMFGNYRQVALIRQVKNDLYEQAVKSGRVKMKNEN